MLPGRQTVIGFMAARNLAPPVLMPPRCRQVMVATVDSALAWEISSCSAAASRLGESVTHLDALMA